jgi:5-methylcytosine-specific restriction endonuclease McrA
MRAKDGLKSRYYAEHRDKILAKLADDRRLAGAGTYKVATKVLNEVLEYQQEARSEYAKTREKYHATRLVCIERLGGKCQRCGWNQDTCALHFDHIDPTTKKFAMSNLLAYGLTPRLEEELAQCQLLCANCHSIKTHREGDGKRKNWDPKIPDRLLRRLVQVSCARCEKVIVTGSIRRKYCSTKCSIAGARLRRRVKVELDVPQPSISDGPTVPSE